RLIKVIEENKELVISAIEFIFWGCFSYNKKGPYYYWVLETKKEKADSILILEELNCELEPKKKEEWELLTAMRKVGLRNLLGKKPAWKWNEKTGKLVRKEGKGGINWWRY
ncbi:unnamed protein product, partial [Fusarium fujikuroi]